MLPPVSASLVSTNSFAVVASCTRTTPLRPGPLAGCFCLLMVRFIDHALPVGSSPADIAAAVGDHDVIFEDKDGAPLLMQAFPDAGWTKIGGNDAVPYGFFASLMLEAEMFFTDAPATPAVFGEHMVNIAPLNSAWQEDLRMAPASQWRAGQLRNFLSQPTDGHERGRRHRDRT